MRATRISTWKALGAIAWAALLFAVVLVPSASASTVTLTVTGTVTTDAGAPADGATVDVVVPADGSVAASTTTAADGSYVVDVDWTPCDTGVVSGINCIVAGPPATPGPGSCAPPAYPSPDGTVCLIDPVETYECFWPYVLDYDECEWWADLTQPLAVLASQTCPFGAIGITPTALTVVISGVTVIEKCEYPAPFISTCPLGTIPVAAECHTLAAPIPGPLTCPPGVFQLIGTQCFTVTTLTAAVYDIVVTPAGGSADDAVVVSLVDLNTTSVVDVEVASGATSNASGLSGAGSGSGATPAVLTEEPLIIGTIAGSSITCTISGAGPHVITVDIPASTALYVDTSEAIAIETSGPGGDARHLLTGFPTATSGPLTLAAGNHSVDLLFVTIFGSVMQSPCGEVHVVLGCVGVTVEPSGPPLVNRQGVGAPSEFIVDPGTATIERVIIYNKWGTRMLTDDPYTGAVWDLVDPGNAGRYVAAIWWHEPCVSPGIEQSLIWFDVTG